ncbi:wall-associated receptor kinase-like 6 [Salvia hispanica]|uniref:wall-associated receptor kinase-like 6 n=1 Tax=Salvia hispanica TaxID=49212 RepID=UPI002009684D|nr:wall-associated receptor kinase-like 6 [Salvia hispanica]
MVCQVSLLPLAIILVLLPSQPTLSNSISRPGCPDRCGNLPIPFPFGVGSDCSLDSSFNISCDNLSNPPKALLISVRSGTELIEIKEFQVRINLANLVWSCYTQTGIDGLDAGFIVNYDISGGGQYTFSDGNRVIAIGCDDAVAFNGEASGRKFAGGCTAVCDSNNGSAAICPNSSDANELGSGCCQTPIPKGTTIVSLTLADLHQKWGRDRKLFNCSYAFLGEKGDIDRRLTQLTDSKSLRGESKNWFGNYTPRVVLDWRIGGESCSRANQSRSTYVCAENSECVDFGSDVGGYNCRCLRGYQGNPYLSPGCLDIDECSNHTLNPCDSNSICANTPGSVNCTCRKGYHGDGLSNGKGCTREPPSEMIIKLLIGLACGLGFLLLLPICFWLHKELKKRETRRRKENLFQSLLLQHQTNEDTFGRTKLFLAKELEKATDNFNENRILGRGGQGVVYKGMLSNGTIVAIKKLKEVDENQVEQFINEVVILSQINHRNVVKLLGCCLAFEVPLLVYEYVPNGTLFDLIHQTELPISWNMRIKIATDIAGAVAYLHFASSVPIYHRDIKSTNILMDEKYVVKVSDFGTSKFVAVDQTHLTTLVKGTFGYLDPEYFQTSQYTDKSDVYSFGVILVELLTGQRAISLDVSQERNLATRFLACMEADNLDAIIDSQVSKQAKKEEVIAVARLAKRCLNITGRMRPNMKEVARELESLTISQLSANVTPEIEEATMYEAKSVLVPNIDYTWTSGDSVSSSSDAHPLMSTKF